MDRYSRRHQHSFFFLSLCLFLFCVSFSFFSPFLSLFTAFDSFPLLYSTIRLCVFNGRIVDWWVWGSSLSGPLHVLQDCYTMGSYTTKVYTSFTRFRAFFSFLSLASLHLLPFLVQHPRLSLFSWEAWVTCLFQHRPSCTALELS